MTYDEYIKFAEDNRLKLSEEENKRLIMLRSAFKAGRNSDQSICCENEFKKYLYIEGQEVWVK